MPPLHLTDNNNIIIIVVVVVVVGGGGNYNYKPSAAAQLHREGIIFTII